METTETKQVVLAWGGCSCQLGYIRWAYVAEYVHNRHVNTEVPGCEKIGNRLFEPPNRKEVSDPKNCDYGKEPSEFPRKLCEEWITQQGYELVDTVKFHID